MVDHFIGRDIFPPVYNEQDYFVWKKKSKRGKWDKIFKREDVIDVVL